MGSRYLARTAYWTQYLFSAEYIQHYIIRPPIWIEWTRWFITVISERPVCYISRYIKNVKGKNSYSLVSLVLYNSSHAYKTLQFEKFIEEMYLRISTSLRNKCWNDEISFSTSVIPSYKAQPFVRKFTKIQTFRDSETSNMYMLTHAPVTNWNKQQITQFVWGTYKDLQANKSTDENRRSDNKAR